MSNGLDDLAGRRRRRQPPPPKHPRSRSEQETSPEDAPEPRPEPESKPAQTPRASKSAQPQAQEGDRSRRSDATRAKRTPSVEAYLDQELMDWLWQIEAAAVARRERSVASPAIRLALRELKKTMNPEQVVDALLSQEAGRQARPRG